MPKLHAVKFKYLKIWVNWLLQEYLLIGKSNADVSPNLLNEWFHLTLNVEC